MQYHRISEQPPYSNNNVIPTAYRLPDSVLTERTDSVTLTTTPRNLQHGTAHGLDTKVLIGRMQKVVQQQSTHAVGT
jgi:galactose mutarotase-like enzyme